MREQPSARRVAAEVLSRVDTDAAYANIILNQRLRQAELEPKEKALATELVYGTLRWRGVLDRAIGVFSNRRLEGLPALVRSVLRLTAYQILYLDRIPPHAAVFEGVELVKHLGFFAWAPYVNAVSRRLLREGVPPIVTDDSATALAETWSHPRWLVQRWLKHYGSQVTEQLLRTNQDAAPLILRANTLLVSRDTVVTHWTNLGIDAYCGDAPEAIIVRKAADPKMLPGYAQGWFMVQDQSSQLVARALDPKPGDRVADLCSAPGGKTTHIAQLMENCGEIVALDVHPHRIRLLEATVARLGIGIVNAVSKDARQIPSDWYDSFDCVLVDAPCSGTGVLRRRVDARWRLRAQDITKMVRVQRQLLAAAAKMVRPGGCLVYSTCSIEPEENTGMVGDFLARHGQFRRRDLRYLAAVAPRLVSIRAHPELRDGELQLMPDVSNDGFFLAGLERCDS